MICRSTEEGRGLYPAPVLLFVLRRGGHKVSVVQERGKNPPVAGNSSKDKNEGTMDKPKGRAEEAAGSLGGNKDLKSEERTNQDKGTLKKKSAAKDLLG